jgi:hypothetical protein
MPILQIVTKQFGIGIILTNQDILSIMATKNIGLEFKTDTRFSYCNTNYAIGFNNRKNYKTFL